MPDEISVPPTPGSVKSFCSKKSVRFRSGHSIIGNAQSHTSPIIIPSNSAPSLSMVNISSTPVFETISKDEENLGLTARPPDMLQVHIPSTPSPKITNRPQLRLKLDDKIGTIPALPTPMPGTNLPLEDPFDDQAATLVSENLISNISGGRVASDQGYIADMEGSEEVNDTSALRMSQTRISYAHSTFDPPPANKKMSKTGTSLVSDSGEESPSNSASRAQKALRRIHAFPPEFKMQSSRPRLPSEMLHDPDIKRSDGSEAQKGLLVSSSEEISLEHQHGRDHTRIVEDIEFSVDLFRCKMPDMPPSVKQATIPHSILDKPSSDEIEEAETSIAPCILQPRGNQVHPATNTFCPPPRPVESALRGIENADPAGSEEPIEVCI
jgi:hypothetical protein